MSFQLSPQTLVDHHLQGVVRLNTAGIIFRNRSKELQQQNLGALLSQIFDNGKIESEVTSDVDIEMLVTGVVGLLSQFASLLYWREFRGSEDDWLPSVKRTIMKMSK